jgi:hypothetical protein
MNAESNQRPLLPWLGGSRLISLLFMKEYLAKDLIDLHSLISRTYLFEGDDPESTTLSDSKYTKHMLLQKISLTKENIPDIQRLLSDLSLPVTACCIPRIHTAMAEISENDLEEHLHDLLKRFEDEINVLKFLWLTPDESSLWQEAENGFGADVSAAFPQSNYDCEESLKCLSLNRYTAAVCHAMRALEASLAQFAKFLNVSCPKGMMADVIKELDDAYKIQCSPKKGQLNGDKQFFAEALVELGYCKDAWRNEAMHASSRYDHDEAWRIVTHTKNFMKLLAPRIAPSL